MKKKLKADSGLTLVEMLCVIPILMLLCLLANTGFNLAVDSLRERTAGSETQLLLSSLTNALTDKLRYCVVTEDTSGGTNWSIGAVEITTDGKVTVGGKKLLYDGAYGNDGTNGADTRYTVETAAVTADTTGPRPIFTVNLKVRGTPSATQHIKAETEFTVRCLNPIKKEGTPP